MGPLKKNERNTFTRREFLGLSWGLSLLGLFAQAGVALARFLKPRIEGGGFGTEIVAGRVDEFLPGTVSHVQEGRFYISRFEDGSFLALWHSCTHLGCTVPWLEDEGRFHCPCHSSIFTPAGEVVSGPAPRPLDIFTIRIVDGDLVVNTARPIQRREFEPGQATHV
jgi:cytochrome b6-f complex iron-sulfur subunit